MSLNNAFLRKQAGFTLMESMIALVIFSIGLLGLAGLQTIGLRNNQTGHLRTIAMQQAYSMADFMRANMTGVRAGSYDNLDSGYGVAPATTDCVGVAKNCTSANIALADYFEWQSINQNPAILPGGHGTVAVQAGGIFRVTVMYDEAGTGVTGTGCSGNPNADLKCYILDLEL